MTAAVGSFTEHGAQLAVQLAAGLGAHGIHCEAWLKKSGAKPPEGVHAMEVPLKEWTREQFREKDALFFIGAAGIAVRSIAPFVKNKKTDPAVVVIDEQAKHAVSLLSGHIGGANALAALAADILGAEPVITTATDLNGKFAVDAFAARRGLYMDSMEYAKAIAAKLVEGKAVGLWSDFPILGRVPEELDMTKEQELGFAVSVRDVRPFPRTLHLIPKAVALGIGCRRGASAEKVEEAALAALKEAGIFKESVKLLASIDLKKDEEGILALSCRWQIPYLTYTAKELMGARAEGGFIESEFVKRVAGVGNVCERAAVLGAGSRRLLMRKQAGGGVTVAAALSDYTVCMEE